MIARWRQAIPVNHVQICFHVTRDYLQPYLRYNISQELEERQDSRAKAKDTTQTRNITIGAEVLRFLALHLAIHL